MSKQIRTMNWVLGARVICVQPPKCETCRNDAAGTNCAKLILAGGQHICVAKK